MESIQKLENNLSSTRSKLISHPLYSSLNTKKRLLFFMENHVFAVWDFMSLIKALQINLTCVDVPWTPNKNNLAGKLVNEIVLAEESDVDPSGNPKSHFELYLDSMQLVGADTKRIKNFIENINETKSYEKSIRKMNLPQPVKEFMDFTFEIINSKKNHIIASVFTFGREDLIPDMFVEIVKKLTKSEDLNSDLLIYYLDRHIELDGDEHGPMALKMIDNLCGNDTKKWEEATTASLRALEMRIKLWDYIYSNLN